jgi:hypothetical protein
VHALATALPAAPAARRGQLLGLFSPAQRAAAARNRRRFQPPRTDRSAGSDICPDSDQGKDHGAVCF